MSSQNRIEQFNQAVDRILSGQAPLEMKIPNEDQPMIDVAQRLAETDLSVESGRIGEIRQALVERAANPEAARENLPKANQTRRVLALGAAALVIGITAVFAVPSLRTLAQDMLIRIGVITISNAPTGMDIYLTEPTPNPASTPNLSVEPQVFEMRRLSVEEANALTGFTIAVPADTPAGYRVSSREVWQKNGLNSVTTIYHNAQLNDSLSISQTIYDISNPSQEREFPAGEASIVEIDVRGVQGAWVEGVTTWPPGTTLNMLFWQEGEFTFMMQSAKLPLDEMLRIAESLAP